MNAAALAHLNPVARAQALLPDDERILAMQRDRWVDYPRAVQARQRLERLLGTPERERMPCMVLHGESNIGKTLIVRKFQREHPTRLRRGARCRAPTDRGHADAGDAGAASFLQRAIVGTRGASQHKLWPVDPGAGG